MFKIGFIGSGNMSNAMVGGILKSKLVKCEDIMVSARSQETLDKIESQYGVNTSLDNKDIVAGSDYIILGVKPYIYEDILREIRDHIREDAVVIGIAAGISIDFMKKLLGNNKQVVRAMPNTPAMVGEGMTALAFDDIISDGKKDEVIKIFNSFGKTEIIGENLMDGFTAVAGSSPAYIYILIEAMADGAVLEGIGRDQAYKMAAQAVLGSAKMALETGLHPGQLKDRVCSPGGTTIEALAKLEDKGFRTAIMEAMRVCAEKSRLMTK